MRIDKDAVIAGLPALELRRLLRAHFDGGWLVAAAARTLQVGEAEAERVLRELEKAGYISIRTVDSDLIWELELKGRSRKGIGGKPNPTVDRAKTPRSISRSRSRSQ